MDLRNAGLDVRLEVLLAHRDGHVPHALQRSPSKLSRRPPVLSAVTRKQKNQHEQLRYRWMNGTCTGDGNSEDFLLATGMRVQRV